MRKFIFTVAVIAALSLAAIMIYRASTRRPSVVPAGEGEPPARVVEGAATVPDGGEEAPAAGLPALTEEERSGATEITLLRATSLVRSPEEDAAKAVAGFIGGLGPADIRWEAARAAAGEGTTAMAEPLADLFRKGEPRARIMAAYAMKGIYDRTGDEKLGRTLEEEAAPLLSEMARTYLDPQIKRDSWTTLGYLDPSRALQLYREQAEMPYVVEERAVLSIGLNGGPEEAERAIAMFEEAATERKKLAACRILGLLGTGREDGAADKFMEEKGLPYIRETLSGTGGDPVARRAAIAALGGAGGGDSIALLRELAREFPREAERAIEQIRSRASAR